MKYSVAALALLAGISQAAPTARSLSKHFKLKATSDDATYNGKTFGTCHIGAAIESLCLYDGDVETFQLNSTASQPALPPNVGPQGQLIWDLPSGSASIPPDAQPMGLYSSSDSEQDFGLTYATFGIGNIQDVAFNSDNEMGIVCTCANGQPQFNQQWYICQLNFEGYIYNTLSWETRSSPPVARECVGVTVTRE